MISNGSCLFGKMSQGIADCLGHAKRIQMDGSKPVILMSGIFLGSLKSCMIEPVGNGKLFRFFIHSFLSRGVFLHVFWRYYGEL